ncbi:hypothetical protein ACLOJK_035880 [Asimina triloba]
MEMHIDQATSTTQKNITGFRSQPNQAICMDIPILKDMSFSKRLSFFLVPFIFLVLPSSFDSAIGITSIIASDKALPSTNVHRTCVHEHFSALLHLKQQFTFTFSLTNLSSWNMDNSDCCSWEGITCHPSTGLVIGLNLSGLYVSGYLDFQSLFGLRSLLTLDLSANSLDRSPIPSGFDQLTNLTHLHLSHCNFIGGIPMDILRLTRLVSLDLSYNNENCFFSGSGCAASLSLKNMGLRRLLQNLSSLRELSLDLVDLSSEGSRWNEVLSYAAPHLQKLSMSYCRLSGPILLSLPPLRLITHMDLSGNNLSSPVPGLIVNFTSLTYLNLQECGLHGEFPSGIFNLPRIQTIYISGNPLLNGYLPEFSSNNSIQILKMQKTGFYGKLPHSLGNLKSLTELSIRSCSILGPIPQTLGKLTQLVTLDLSKNSLSGPMLQSLLNLTQLAYLDLSDNRLTGPIPSALFCLRSLKHLNLSHNHFSGELGRFGNVSSSLLHTVALNGNNLQGSVPSSLFELTKIVDVDLSSNNFSSIEFWNRSSSLLHDLSLDSNNFHGSIPKLIFELTSLRSLSLSLNNFTDVLDLGLFHNHKNLFSLDLSYNSLTAIIDTRGKSMPTSFPQLAYLNLRSCNIKKLPDVLRNQVGMRHLDLSSNEISGKIPQWIWKLANVNMNYLNLSHNAFDRVEGHSSVFASRLVVVLDLSFNKLKGLIPIPSIGSHFFSISNNQFSGDVPTQICHAEFLEVIDLSHNNFSGMIPKCLGGMSNALFVLKLGGNNFNGTLLQAFENGCKLRTIDLNGNRLEGHVPESLANCKMLEVLNVGNNRIHDTFPVWLKNLPRLRILVLRSNQFHGTLGYHPTVGDFPQLQIFDISFNNFTGRLPSNIFKDWKSMMVSNKSGLLYIGHSTDIGIYYEDTVTVVGKGSEMKLDRILSAFTLLDLSNNRLEGSIPVSVGDLWSLHIINMSHNSFAGEIPASMGNIRELESLDLSQNELSGDIPRQLANLPWLAVLDLSQNLLVGRIPQGPQFNTFTNESFQGNLGLCGAPLSNKCEDDDVVLAPAASGTEEILESEYDWGFMWTGFGIGHGVGWGVLLWTLALWRKGRIAFFSLTDRMLSFLFPPAAFSHRHGNRTRNGKPRLKIRSTSTRNMM